jgi:hypothetical protein
MAPTTVHIAPSKVAKIPTGLMTASPALEGTLLEKLRKIEALYAGTNVDGEREAARRAAERIRARLAELRGSERDEVLVYSLPDPWKRKLARGRRVS